MNLAPLWKPYFDAFERGDIDKMLSFYDNQSIVYMWDHRGGHERTIVYLGPKEIKSLLEVWKSKKPETICVEICDERSCVFLKWSCPSENLKSVDEIFIIDTKKQIFTHHSISMY